MGLRAVVLLALLAGVAEAGAQERAVGARIGMLGLGIEYAHPFGERIAVRGGVYGSTYSFNQSESGIDYNFELGFDSIALGVDFHPLKGSLRLSAGLLKNDNSYSVLSTITDNVDVGGTTYTPAEVGALRGVVSFDDVAPFLGVGWDWSRGKRFGVSLDIGAVSQGSPEVTLTADGGLAGDPVFDADVAEEQAELQDSLSDLDLLPFASFGMVFRF